jgi:hypothetical protein
VINWPELAQEWYLGIIYKHVLTNSLKIEVKIRKGIWGKNSSSLDSSIETNIICFFIHVHRKVRDEHLFFIHIHIYI